MTTKNRKFEMQEFFDGAVNVLQVAGAEFLDMGGYEHLGLVARIGDAHLFLWPPEYHTLDYSVSGKIGGHQIWFVGGGHWKAAISDLERFLKQLKIKQQ